MRYLLLSLCCWLVLMGTVRAETTIIYRKSDQLVVGSVQPPQSVAVEIQNITQSELKGVPGDYETLVIPDLTSDQVVTITPQGKPVVVKNPVATKQQGDRQSALAKFKGLGLSQAEVEAVFGK